ncbi:hypothetical protein AB0K60_26935 [Thermopolyspora sp. NPDC052614]|uniref:hypothetical protein n=1 Tax=Thermopolyspora sp. NPDC052614 TaxID=3155682 RepID=UPI0034244F66
MSGRNPRWNPHPPIENPPPRRAGLLVRLWRLRTEILLLACLTPIAVTVTTAVANGAWWSPALVGGTLLALAAPRPVRAWFIARFWCVVSRHRMQRLFIELPLHTRKGRLPLVLWITPTREGEKALILCRAGMSADAFAAFTAEFEAACSATEVRFAKHARRPQFVTIDIVRRSPGSGTSVPGLETMYGYNWIALERDPKEPAHRWEATTPFPVPEQIVPLLPEKTR